MGITVTRGLVELKTLDKRINDAIKRLNPVDVKYMNQLSGKYKNQQEFEQIAKADYQSLKDLIERRRKIKSAIVKSNASTTVKVLDYDITVAEAIEMKTQIGYENNLLDKLRQANEGVASVVERKRIILDEKLENYLNNMLGSDKKGKDAEVQVLTESFWKTYNIETVDPLDIKKEIEKLRNEINDFEAEIDFVLSESNCKTIINID